MLVKDIWPGAIGGLPVFIGVVNNKVIFHAQDGQHGAEPWVSDGTEGGTFMLHDIMEGGQFASSFPRPGISYNGHLYFFAGAESAYAHDLWRTDGTAAGTESFLNVLPNDGDIQINGGYETFALFGGYLYFVDAHPTDQDMVALWRTDGTTQGTELVYGALSIGRSFRTPLGVFDGHLYFPVELSLWGQALYRIDLDGNAEEVFALNSFGSSIGYPTAAASGLYFFGEDQTNGRELYWTDGTTAGTHMISSFPGTGVTGFSHNYDHSWYHLDGDTMLFKADGGDEGTELWITDGTLVGTHLLKDLLPGQFSGSPMSFFGIDDQVYFSAYTVATSDSAAIWVTDGTEAGTTRLFTLAGTEFYGVNNDVLHLAGNGPRELYFSHGEVNDTVQVTSPDTAATCCGLVRYVLPALNGYFISAYVYGVGEELFFYGNDVGIPVRSDEPARGVRPVPVVDHLFVDVDPSTPVRVRICTSVGEEVIASALLTPDNGVDVITLPPGLYIITVVQEGTTWSQRFIKL
jgi:ELWxxDGT repeat protein